MLKQEKIDNIILNENAYFYLKENVGYLSKNLVTKTFREASAEKKGNYLLKEIRKKHQISATKFIYYSVAVFKYEKNQHSLMN